MKTTDVRGCLVALSCLMAACSGLPTEPTNQPPTPFTLSLRSDAWQSIATPDPYPLSNDAGPDLVFEFPVDGSMHYLYTPTAVTKVRGTVVVQLRINTAGPVLFNSLDPLTPSCSIQPSVRPFFWANQNGSGSFDRWWSNPQAYPLAAGTATISVPLEPEHWSSVNGRRGSENAETRYGFARATQNMSRLGLTFGGGCSFGHGISVLNGDAEFRLTDYSIR